jgi:pyrroloquinoline quinone (PQQ) biosynthesis protein C
MKALLEEHLERIAPDVESFAWGDRASYADFMAQTYFYVRHSTRLLAAAVARFDLDERGNALHRRFAEHLAEEKSHEKLALHDLKNLGESLESYPELPITRMFYEAQYFKIEHLSPLALFGYILGLEAIGPRYGTMMNARIAEAFGRESTTFLRLHTEEDVDHLDKALRMIDAASGGERALIADNLCQTLYAYGAILAQIRLRRARAPR